MYTVQWLVVSVGFNFVPEIIILQEGHKIISAGTQSLQLVLFT